MPDEKKIENCDFNEFVKTMENLENKKSESIEDIIESEEDAGIVFKELLLHYCNRLFDCFDRLFHCFKYIKRLPKQNYHILGYITFLYLAYVLCISWEYSADYVYYEILRWLMTCFFGWTAIKVYKNTPQSPWILVFAAIAVLFNPVAKIGLEESIWKFVDIATVALYFIYLFTNRKRIS